MCKAQIFIYNKEIYRYAIKISYGAGSEELRGKTSKKNPPKLHRGDDKEKHVEKYHHKKANHYSRRAWEISDSIWGLSYLL